MIGYDRSPISQTDSPKPRAMDEPDKELTSEEALLELNAMIDAQKLIDRFAELWGVNGAEIIFDAIDRESLSDAYNDLRRHLRKVKALVWKIVEADSAYAALNEVQMLEKFFHEHVNLQGKYPDDIENKLDLFKTVENAISNLYTAAQQYRELTSVNAACNLTSEMSQKANSQLSQENISERRYFSCQQKKR